MKTKQLTNDLLKEKMTDAMVDRGHCADLDACVAIGVFYTSPQTVGTFPPNIGTLAKYAVVENTQRGIFTFQRLTCEDGRQAVRIHRPDGWIPWKEPVYQ